MKPSDQRIKLPYLVGLFSGFCSFMYAKSASMAGHPFVRDLSLTPPSLSVCSVNPIGILCANKCFNTPINDTHACPPSWNTSSCGIFPNIPYLLSINILLADLWSTGISTAVSKPAERSCKSCMISKNISFWSWVLFIVCWVILNSNCASGNVEIFSESYSCLLNMDLQTIPRKPPHISSSWLQI